MQWLDGILLDVTQRKEAERSLQRLNESLEEIVVQRTQEVRALAAGLAMTEQHERSQIAQRLHDELQQFLYGVQVKTNMFIRNLRTRTDVDLTDAAVDPSKIEHMLQQAIDTTRGLTVDLAPPVLDQDGLLEALQWLRSHMHATSGLTVTLHGTLSDIHIPHAIQMVLFQAVRALLINVTEHARVDRAWVQLRQVDDAIIIRVVDEGVGFDVDALDVSHTGSGIRTSAERLRFLGGTLSVSSTPGDGTTCLIHLPEEAVHNAPTMPTATSITR